MIGACENVQRDDFNNFGYMVIYDTCSSNDNCNYDGIIIKPSHIRIPDDVTQIESQAFYYNTDLISIEITEGVETIGDEAFAGCSNLESITFPNSLRTIGNKAFRNCSSLTSIIIPNNITIGRDAFKDCGCEESLYQPGVELINCTDVRGMIECTDNNSCGDATNIRIPEGTEFIPMEAFRGNRNLVSVHIPDSVRNIGVSAFSECSRLISVTIGNSVTTIDEFAFSECIRLESIVIPDSVESIGRQAFYGCYRLTTITIPYSVRIGNRAFEGCGCTEELYQPGVQLSRCNISEKQCTDNNSCGNATHIRIPDGITTIEAQTLLEGIQI